MDYAYQELARSHHEGLTREADAHRLAAQARGATRRQRRLGLLVQQIRRRRTARRPAPAA